MQVSEKVGNAGAIVFALPSVSPEGVELVRRVVDWLNKNNSNVEMREAALKEFLRNQVSQGAPSTSLNSALTPVAKAVNEFLEPAGKVLVTIDKAINPADFLKTREGLYVEEDFRRLFVGGEVSDLPDQIELSKYILKRDSFDSEIRSELPKGHIFEATEFCYMLASMLDTQEGGVAGVLRNDGRAEIFYVRSLDGKQVFAVRVSWFSDGPHWDVSVWELGAPQWAAERSVSSRN